MPLYPANPAAQPPTSIGPGDSFQVWVPADAIANGARSQRVAIARKAGESLTPFSVDIDFNQAPGAYELDVTVSNSSDIAADYCQVAGGNMTTVDASATNPKAHFVANAEIAVFVSVVWKTAPANGGTTATVTIRR